MEAISASNLKGNWATLLLPINEDDSINYTLLEQEINTLISMKVDGIYSNGTAGEFYTLTETEFDKTSQLLADKCNQAGMPFQIGCSHMSPQISLERLKRILPLKPSAVQVILPDWFPPTLPEIIDFLKRMAKAAEPIGLVLYNPPHAKKKLSPEDFYQIIQAGVPLIGCKVAGGDEHWYAAMKQSVPELSLFVPGHHLATGVKLGAHGAYSNVACLNPLIAQEWYNTMLTNIDQALEMETRIQLFMDGCIVPYIRDKGFSNQAVDKLLAAIGGWTDINTRLRWPYKWIPQSDVEPLRKHAQQLLPEFFTL